MTENFVNFTIPVPLGTVNHGDTRLICTPPKWYDYLVFYLTNYFAHAITVVASPGQGYLETTVAAVMALVFPGTGVLRASIAMLRRPRFFHKDMLQRAVEAGAICMVARENDSRKESATNEDIELGGVVSNAADTSAVAQGPKVAQAGADASVKIEENGEDKAPEATTSGKTKSEPWWECNDAGIALRRGTLVHGKHTLPEGYCFRVVAPGAPIKFPADTAHVMQPKLVIRKTFLSSTYSATKPVISLVQAIWATVTLYRARGNQIDEYGYAVFGLTVAPYAWMSVVNIIATLWSSTYPALFVIRTPIMDEAEAAGGSFNCELLVDLGESKKDFARSRAYRDYWARSLALFFALIPLIIVGCLSRFAARSSTPLQRGFTMSWLVVGTTGGWGELYNILDNILLNIVPMLSAIVPALGGMVVVGMMLHDFGVCTRFT